MCTINCFYSFQRNRNFLLHFRYNKYALGCARQKEKSTASICLKWKILSILIPHKHHDYIFCLSGLYMLNSFVFPIFHHMKTVLTRLTFIFGIFFVKWLSKWNNFLNVPRGLNDDDTLKSGIIMLCVCMCSEIFGMFLIKIWR